MPIEELDGPERALYISTLTGGRTSANSSAIAAVRRLHLLVHGQAHPVLPTDLQVDLIFQIPGDQLSPDFVGVRTGRLARRERLLAIQVSVPIPFPDSPSDYFSVVLREAKSVLMAFVKRRKIDLKADEALTALDDARSRLQDLPTN